MKHFTLRIVVVAMVMVLFVGVSAFGAGQEEKMDGTIHLRFANVYPADHPQNKDGAYPLAESLPEDSGLTMSVYPNSQLGNERALSELLQAGEIEMALVNSSFLANFYPPIGVFNADFLFSGPEDLAEITNGPIGQELWDGLLEKTGMRVLGTWYYGARHLTTKNTAVHSPADLKGLKIRAADNPVVIETVAALGATPVPVAFPELYMALQQGAVDGQENPIPTIAGSAFGEVQDYLMLTGHRVMAIQVLISDKVWQKMTDDQRRVLQEGVNERTPEVAEGILQIENDKVEEWKKTGTFTVIDDLDFKAFHELAHKHFPGKFAAEWGDYYERITAVTQK